MGNVPATSQTPDVEAGPRPQNMSGEVTLAMGLLSLTVRTQVPALSSLPTQSSCQVEWAETVAAAARKTVAYFILNVDREGVRCERRWRCVSNTLQVYPNTLSIYSLFISIVHHTAIQHANLPATI
jgi:hypothetical protein